MVCVEAGGNDDLEERKIYEVLPDTAAGTGFLRIVDDSGEDYLYPGRLFVPFQVPDLLRSVLENPRHRS